MSSVSVDGVELFYREAGSGPPILLIHGIGGNAVNPRGDSDAYVVCDLPDNESAAAVALTVNAAGGATVRTVVLLTPDEVDAAAKRSVEYRPPSA